VSPDNNQKMNISTFLMMMLIFFVAIVASGQKSNFNTVNIGTQVWMSENLSIKKFRNGDLIPYANTKEQWEQAARNKSPAWCYFDDDDSTAIQHGILYNWYAVNDPRGLAPQGWHIPSNAEWQKLFDFLGGMKLAGIKMKSKTGWTNDGNGTNESGFSAYASGRRNNESKYTCKNIWGIWWSANESSNEVAWSVGLVYVANGINLSDFHQKFEGLSVRCLKD
jgi:uncharacterized protein (TIGR02145 family)